jgi:hypothetical protein
MNLIHHQGYSFPVQKNYNRAPPDNTSEAYISRRSSHCSGIVRPIILYHRWPYCLNSLCTFLKTHLSNMKMSPKILQSLPVKEVTLI